ncbi:HEAT repeat-containing protein 1 [Schistocerca piceifrons]|uniref:HEAT repeat-containing protein 1 n=1 Tax=Schistocerca piceifrons TaxID=274613 RepID=UPI001F5EAC7A|nr:HEAT repeat-containing protein 1 [Schistocerca piceifrons]
MATSLAEQLKKLTLPQTSLLVHEKKRASFLFDPKEAANLDRDAVYELGMAGLHELKTLNSKFADFETTLFSLLSKSLERSVESSEANEKLNQHIERFLLMLSPYFLLKPAHKVLEWLIYRFHINQYNVDELMMLILPYHESLLFVRMVQLFDVKDPANKWHWLHPLQKPGVPLSKTTLLNHCASDVGFLNFVCEMALKAVKVNKDNAAVLTTLFAFTSTTIVGALECKKSVLDVQIMHILKILIKALHSPVFDFAASAFMITAQLARKSLLSEKLLTTIIIKVSKNPNASLTGEIVLLLLQLYQFQNESLSTFPRKALLNIVKRKDFPVILGKLATAGGVVTPLLIPLLSQILCTMEQQPECMEELKNFADELFTEVPLDSENDEVFKIVQSFIDTFYKSEVNNDSDSVDKNILEIYSSLLSRIEKQYPSKFDAAVCKLMTNSNTSDKCKELLHFMPDAALRQGNTALFEKINHPSADVRIKAIEYMGSKYMKIKAIDEQLLVDSLSERMKDDSPRVVKKVFSSFDSSVLTLLLGPDYLLKNLIQLAKKCWILRGEWTEIAASVLNIICSEQVNNFFEKDGHILVTVFPYLFPGGKAEAQIARDILTSFFAGTNMLLTYIRRGMPDPDKCDTTQICVKTFRGLITCHSIPGMSEYLQEAAQLVEPENSDTVEKFLALLFKSSAITKKVTAKESKKILDEAVAYVEGSKVTLAGDGKELGINNIHKCFKVARMQKLPLEAFLHCVSILIKYTTVPPKLRTSIWWDLKGVRDEEETVTAAKFLIRMFEVLVAGCSLQPQEERTKCAYIIQLREFFQEYFPQFSNQMNFLSNMWIGHAMTEANDIECNIVSYELQLRSLCLATSLLRQSESSIGWMLSYDEITVPALLIALSCPVSLIRVASLDCLSILGKSFGGALSESSYIHLVNEILIRKEEIILDAEQLPVIMYVLLSTDPEARTVVREKNRTHMDSIREALVSCATIEENPTYMAAALLKILSNVTSSEMLMKLVCLGNRIMINAGKSDKKLDYYSSSILRGIVKRLDEETVDCLKHPACFVFFETMLLDQKTHVFDEDEKVICPSVLAMEQISSQFFESVPDLQQHILGIILDLGYESDAPDVISAIAHLWKRITLDARLIVAELDNMYNAKICTPPPNTRKKRVIKTAPSLEILKTSAWKRGVTLLELIQNKKKLYSVHHILPVLFGILQRCLEFEEQSPVEYTKQLVLSCILNCCQKLSADGIPSSVTEDEVNVSLLVQCIRGTQNPQTHHHALLVLSQVAEMIPDQVLHNIMEIFTFMGSSVLRQDDAYSFQVISKIVETVIPLIIRAEHSGVLTEKMNSQLEDIVAKVMRVFVDAVMDIPEHRRISLFHKLLQTLNAEKFLWLFISLVLESHVLRGNDGVDNRNTNKKGCENKEQNAMPKRLEFLMNITKQFSPYVIIKNCVSVIRYVRLLPSSKENFFRLKKKMGATLPPSSLFDIAHHTDKQLRHYRYTLVTFLSSLLSSASFVAQVAALTDDETVQLESLYREFIENILCLIQSCAQEADINSGKATAKYWKVKLNQCYDILDKVNALLPRGMFLLVIQGLLQNELLTVRRKALELLNAKLQYRVEFVSTCKPEELLSLLLPVTNIIKCISSGEESTQEEEMIQQTALFSVKLFARALAAEHPDEFKKMLDVITQLVKSDLPLGNLLATVLLCLAELCSTLRANAIAFLPKFMPSLIKILQKHNDLQSPDVVLLAIITALHKIVESLSNFLSPYLDKILLEICKISARWQHEQENQKTSSVLLKLKGIRQKIATSVPSRILIPSVKKCYSKVMAEDVQALGPLAGVLADSFSAMSAAELQHQMLELTNFFLTALQFRSETSSHPADVIFSAEGHIIDALAALVLKLSESSFRPLYYNIFHWATATEAHKDRIITFYRLSSNIAECLKGLFVLFAGHFIKNAAQMLDQNNETKTEDLYFGKGEEAEAKAAVLLEYILKTLHKVFLYDSHNFTNKERFDSLMQPVVDQMENTLGGVENLQSRVKNLLTPCIAQFAVATADDTLWKQLNYQVLLKTRHNTPQIRLIALETLCEVARKLGEDFLPLLPETVPFLAELLEDEDEEVEKACTKSVQELEEILGEPLQKYF